MNTSIYSSGGLCVVLVAQCGYWAQKQNGSSPGID